VRAVDRLRGYEDPAVSPGRGSRRHIGGPARLEGVMTPSDSMSLTLGKDGRWRRLRAPWRHGAWTPEEVALALHERREELLREVRGRSRRSRRRRIAPADSSSNSPSNRASNSSSN
jgi:hypothetical protein